MNEIRAFIFDLDGVLTDTSEFHYLAWQRLADEEGLPFSRQANEALRGVSRRDSLNLILNGKKISEETAETWMDRKNGYYLDLVKAMTPENILPGVSDLLNELVASGIKRAIASSSKNAPLVMERLKISSLIDVVVDGTMVTISKPAPDLFLKAAQLLNIPANNCVIVEDAAVGVDAGRLAGMRTIGLGPNERVGHADLNLPDLSKARLAEILAHFQ